MIVHVVFDGPPGPVAGRFIEVETPDGKGLSVGRWIERDDGYWALEIDVIPKEPARGDTERPGWDNSRPCDCGHRYSRHDQEHGITCEVEGCDCHQLRQSRDTERPEGSDGD